MPIPIQRPAIVLAALAALAAPTAIVGQDRKSEVLEAGQAVFEAMARRDTAALRRLIHPSITLFAAVQTDGQTELRTTWISQFLEQIANAAAIPLERMWNAEVRVSGPIATIWTQYDFHRGAEFSHCGIDSFQLVKTAAGWQVTGLIYTVVRERCPKNPAGPPG
jgi:hypothetical protein